MKYQCIYCNYETYDFGNFSRHKNSKRHLKNSMNQIINPESRSSGDPKTIQKDPVEENKDSNTCMYCNKFFSQKTNLYRHQNHRCKIKKKQDSEVKELKGQISDLIKTNLNNSQIAKKSISTLGYAIQNFQDAPTICLLEGKKLDGLIEYNGNTDKSLEEVLIHHFDKKKLHQLLGDLIIKEYKKENPKKQSIWSTDVSRLTFILKQAVKNTKKGKWMTGPDIICFKANNYDSKNLDKLKFV